MCLSIGLDTLGLLLRIWLWISVPMAVIILMVATWMNYLRNIRSKDDLRLAVEGFGGEVLPGGGDMYIRRDDLVGEGEALLGERGEADRGEGEETVRGERETVREEEGGSGPGERGEAGEEELTATGKETIYQGILWMKEKYEQYREQADRRYEQLRQELGRSERRYGELLATMGQNKNGTSGTVMDNRQEGGGVAPGGGVATEDGVASGLGDQLAEVRGQLDTKQGIIEELETQLRSERMKVEELVLKLQVNSQLLLTIYRELDKSFHVGENIPDLGK
jgi:hypothetical protein